MSIRLFHSGSIISWRLLLVGYEGVCVGVVGLRGGFVENGMGSVFRKGEKKAADYLESLVQITSNSILTCSKHGH